MLIPFHYESNETESGFDEKLVKTMTSLLCEAKKNDMPNNMPLLNDFYDCYKKQKFDFQQVADDIVSEETSKGVKECFALFGPKVY